MLLRHFHTTIRELKCNYQLITIPSPLLYLHRKGDFMYYISLGKRIREERLKLNLTQEQLAEYADISASYMGQIERGERKVTLDTLIKVTNKLRVSIDYLLKDSTTINDDDALNQLKQLLSDKSLPQKQMAVDVVKVMFSHLTNIN